MSRRGAIVGSFLLALVAPGCAGLPAAAPTCDALEVLALQAQSVPAADAVVCLADVPDGWTVSEFSAGDRGTRFALDHAVGGRRSVVVDVADDCLTADGSKREGQRPAADDPIEDLEQRGRRGLVGERLVALGDACASIHLSLRTEQWPDVLEEFDRMLVSVARSELVARLLEASDGRLDLRQAEG